MHNDDDKQIKALQVVLTQMTFATFLKIPSEYTNTFARVLRSANLLMIMPFIFDRWLNEVIYLKKYLNHKWNKNLYDL